MRNFHVFGELTGLYGQAIDVRGCRNAVDLGRPCAAIAPLTPKAERTSVMVARSCGVYPGRLIMASRLNALRLPSVFPGPLERDGLCPSSHSGILLLSLYSLHKIPWLGTDHQHDTDLQPLRCRPKASTLACRSQTLIW